MRLYLLFAIFSVAIADETKFTRTARTPALADRLSGLPPDIAYQMALEYFEDDDYFQV